MNIITLVLLIVLFYLIYITITRTNTIPINIKEPYNNDNRVLPYDNNHEFAQVKRIILEEPKDIEVNNIFDNYEMDDTLCNNNTRSDIGLRDLNTITCPVVKEPNTKVIEERDLENNGENSDMRIADIYDRMVNPEYIKVDKELIDENMRDKCIDEELCLDRWNIYEGNIPGYNGNTLEINNWGTYKDENQINGGIHDNLMAYDPNGDKNSIIM